MDTRMVAAARGAWVIMAIHREGMEETGVEIMEAVEVMEEVGGIINLEALAE